MRNWLRRLVARSSRPQTDGASQPSPPARYRDLIAPLPIPTPEQTDRFAEYVVGAHSWYKHLPCNPPGDLFMVFLDPNVGRTLVQTASDRAKERERIDEGERFHHISMPTAEYLTKFGHWHFARNRGTHIVVQRPDTDHAEVPRHALARVTAPDGTSVDVSPEVLAAGTVHLTAHVHRLFDAGCVFMLANNNRRFREKHGAEYPSYGLEIIDLYDRHKDDLPGFDRQIEAERARQRAELRGALHRVRTLLAPGEGR